MATQGQPNECGVPAYPAATGLDASVIVATYRQLAITSLAAKALLEQRTRCRYEVILCDDGSDTTTLQGLRDVIVDARVPAYIAWQQDKGFRLAASRNNGIRLSRGRILIFLDGDMVPAEDFVEAHVRAHDQPNQIGVGKRAWRVAEAVRAHDGDMQSLWQLLQGEGATDRTSRAKEAFELLYRHFIGKAAPWMNCFGCNISVAKSPLVRFDEGFAGWGNEDWDLFYGLTTVHGYVARPVGAVGYEVSGEYSKQGSWRQSHFKEHLVTAFRFFDKWAPTGLSVEQAIPRYDFDVETGLWSFSRRPILGGRANDFPEYVAETRRWLASNGLYPAEQG